MKSISLKVVLFAGIVCSTLFVNIQITHKLADVFDEQSESASQLVLELLITGTNGSNSSRISYSSSNHGRRNGNSSSNNNSSHNNNISNNNIINNNISNNGNSNNNDHSERCAINFYGLPRSFQKIVLPSIVKHVIVPNQVHHCDYFVHFNVVQEETVGRAGMGGRLDPTQIYLLRDQVLLQAANETRSAAHDRNPTVLFSNSTEHDFMIRRGAFLNSTRHDRRDDGTLKYFPDDPSKGFIHPTSTDNIVKMWHSQESVWNLMESHAKRQGIRYTRVAMLRSDVFFVTPIDIYAPRNISLVIPAFSKWPINDRMAYGDHEAVKLWATGRFANIERHLNHTDHWEMRPGIHSEIFLDQTLFPMIRDMGYTIQENPDICFLRSRTDHTVWLSDCGNVEENQQIVQDILHRPCNTSRFDPNPLIPVQITKNVVFLDCKND